MIYFKGSLLYIVGLAFLALFSPACTLSRPPVYIPTEFSSPSPEPRYSAPQPAAAPGAPAQQGPLIGRSSEFKKHDLPTITPAQPVPAPQAQPPRGDQPQFSPPAPAPSRKTEPQTPQLLASMQLVNEAREPLDRGKPDLAIPVLERAIQVDVQNPEAFLLLARAWRQKGARKKALEFAKKAEILYQDEPARLKEVFRLEADLYKEAGDNTKASQYRRKVAELR